MERVPFGKFGFISRTTVDWLSSHVSALMSGAMIIIGVTIWSIYQSNLGSPKDYFMVEKTFNQWDGGRNEQLVKLQKFLKQHPELHAKYDGRIAQKLLLCSEQGLAASFSKLALGRVGKLSPYYTQFSNGSLLIGEKNLEAALASAKMLKHTLDQDQLFWETKSGLLKHGQILYGYNLLRIAFLEQALGNRAGEIEAWREFKREAGWMSGENPSIRSDPTAYALICQNFQNDDVSLRDFIEHREKSLENLSQ